MHEVMLLFFSGIHKILAKHWVSKFTRHTNSYTHTEVLLVFFPTHTKEFSYTHTKELSYSNTQERVLLGFIRYFGVILFHIMIYSTWLISNPIFILLRIIDEHH